MQKGSFDVFCFYQILDDFAPDIRDREKKTPTVSVDFLRSSHEAADVLRSGGLVATIVQDFLRIFPQIILVV